MFSASGHVPSASACPKDGCLWTRPGTNEVRRGLEITIERRSGFHVELNIYPCKMQTDRPDGMGGIQTSKEWIDYCEEHAAAYFPIELGDGDRAFDELTERYLATIESGRIVL